MENLVICSDIDEMKKQLEEKDKIIADLMRYKAIVDELSDGFSQNVFTENEEADQLFNEIFGD